MAWRLRFEGEIRPTVYAVAAPALILSQHLIVALASAALGEPVHPDAEFWLLPLRSLARISELPPWLAAAVFLASLAAIAALALISFRRASVAGRGYELAALVVVPVLQILPLAALALLPANKADAPEPPESRANLAAILSGLFAGMALIVLAAAISAVVFGAYGWGLFVVTPFVVGLTTAYLANRSGIVAAGRTNWLVLGAAALGCLMLIAVALEGLICIILAAPLGAVVALLGGSLGRLLAVVRGGDSAPLACVAVLPLVFAIEGAMPPNVPIHSAVSIDIAAPPQAVWRALTAGDDVQPAPGLVFRLGLAYPIRARIIGQGVGAERIGIFSTGLARERITAWAPGRRLAFAVLSQPPAMAELSPYAEVHAPHVRGYFDTLSTSFDLQALPGGGTRLTASADHVLRLDPVLYWEPVARWAIRQNIERVLRHIRARAEAGAFTAS